MNNLQNNMMQFQAGSKKVMYPSMDFGSDDEDDRNQIWKGPSSKEVFLSFDPYENDDFDKMYESISADLDPHATSKKPQRSGDGFVTTQYTASNEGSQKPRVDLRQHLNRKRHDPHFSPSQRMPDLVPADLHNQKRRAECMRGQNINRCNGECGIGGDTNNTVNFPDVVNLSSVANLPGNTALNILGNTACNSIMPYGPNYLGTLNGLSGLNCLPMTIGLNPLGLPVNGFGLNGIGMNAYGIGVNPAISLINSSMGIDQNVMANSLLGPQIGAAKANGQCHEGCSSAKGHFNGSGSYNGNGSVAFNKTGYGGATRHNGHFNLNMKRGRDAHARWNPYKQGNYQNKNDSQKVGATHIPAMLSMLEKIIENGVTIQMTQNDQNK